LTPSTSVQTASNPEPTKYQVDFNTNILIHCTGNGANGTARDLTVSMVFVLK
jgi:hypothetical protein